MILKGRRKIVTEFKSADLLDKVNLLSLLNSAYKTHVLNKAEIDYLIDYRKGVQPILGKEKVVRDEINNILVVNHAEMITRNIIGYFLGTPIQYIQNGDSTKLKDEIDFLNRCVAYEDKPAIDKEIGEYQSITGTGYRIVYSDGVFADEVPFENRALNPSTTYVVYENNVADRPILGVTYYNVYDDANIIIGVKMYVYTDHGLYEFMASPDAVVTMESPVTFSPYDVGGIPIIEYPNNMWRLGDWELCISLMDAINSLQSGRLDDVDQIVQSLLVFINADIDVDTYDQMREKGVVMLKNNSGNPSSVDSIENSLDQNGMNTFSEELESLLYAIIGIPDRKNRSGGGGDTGQAVELRDGWADLEIVARNKELVFKKSEKQSLKIMLNIMRNKNQSSLKLLDVDIKFSRNKNNNLLVKTQSYQTLIGTKTLSPADCLTIVDLVSDVNEYISRGKTFWGDSFAGLVEHNNKTELSSVAVENAKNPPEPKDTTSEQKSQEPIKNKSKKEIK